MDYGIYLCYSKKKEVMYMRDIPVFDTQYGVGSLALKEVAYRQEAYITVGAVSDGKKFLEEAASFCVALGAQKVYATGDPAVESYPLFNTVLLLAAGRDELDQTDACLFPVTEETAAKWKSLYFEKFRKVPNAATITDKEMMEIMNTCYFVHKNEKLIGIGKADGDRIGAIASFVPGGGRDVVLALAHVLPSERVTIEVASANSKAYSLYTDLGFIKIEERIKWYRIR